MSWAFITALKKNPQQSYVQLLNSIRDELSTKYTQKPQLSCSHPLSSFIFPSFLLDIMLNGTASRYRLIVRDVGALSALVMPVMERGGLMPSYRCESQRIGLCGRIVLRIGSTRILYGKIAAVFNYQCMQKSPAGGVIYFDSTSLLLETSHMEKHEQ